ncbi:MAG: hypothetical protein ISS36_02170 [Candidatus Aenigmarchaeota archaeon]|nr:hypothetical protein [Candidatus Aenigmarchaeota archaeon]
MPNTQDIVVVDIDGTVADCCERKFKSLHDSGVHILETEDFFVDSHLTPEQLKTFLSIFLSNKYIHLDEPVPYAAEVLQRLEKSGKRIVYLTARHDSDSEDSMRWGTIQWLKRYNFPLDTDHLFMKIDKGESNRECKEREMREISGLGNVYAGIGDMREDADVYLKFTSNCVLLTTFHPESEYEGLDKRVKLVDDWQQIGRYLGV